MFKKEYLLYIMANFLLVVLVLQVFSSFKFKVQNLIRWNKNFHTRKSFEKVANRESNFYKISQNFWVYYLFLENPELNSKLNPRTGQF